MPDALDALNEILGGKPAPDVLDVIDELRIRATRATPEPTPTPGPTPAPLQAQLPLPAATPAPEAQGPKPPSKLRRLDVLLGQRYQKGVAEDFYGFLDRGARLIAKGATKLGVPEDIAYGGAFRKLQDAALAGVGDVVQPEGVAEKTAAAIARMLGGELPKMAVATAVGGPIAGFAGLGGAEAAVSGGGPKEIAAGAAQGALMGGIFRAVEPLGRAVRAALLTGTGTAAAKGGGEDTETALAHGLALGLLGAAGGPGRLTAREALGDFARSLRRPVTEPPEAPAIPGPIGPVTEEPRPVPEVPPQPERPLPGPLTTEPAPLPVAEAARPKPEPAARARRTKRPRAIGRTPKGQETAAGGLPVARAKRAGDTPPVVPAEVRPAFKVHIPPDTYEGVVGLRPTGGFSIFMRREGSALPYQSARGRESSIPAAYTTYAREVIGSRHELKGLTPTVEQVFTDARRGLERERQTEVERQRATEQERIARTQAQEKAQEELATRVKATAFKRRQMQLPGSDKPVMVLATDKGLGVAPVPLQSGKRGYALVHLASGVSASRPVETQAKAKAMLVRLTDLGIDWKRPRGDFESGAAFRDAGYDLATFADFNAAIHENPATAVVPPRPGAKAAPVSQELKARAKKAAVATEAAKQKGSVTIGREAAAPLQGVEDFGKPVFRDPDVEAQYRQARRGVLPIPFRQRAREWADAAWRKTTRGAFEHLPRTARFADTRARLLELQKARMLSGDQAARELQGLVGAFDESRFDLFSRKVLLDDLLPEAREGRNVPFGFTRELLESEHPRITALADANPDVAEALKLRRQLWDRVRADYGRAMRAIGLDIEGKFTKLAYFRHQILEYAAKTSSERGGKGGLRAPGRPSYLRRRRGSAMPINANYLEAEFEVLTHLYRDMKVAEFLKHVDDTFNIQRDLVRDAREANEAAIFPFFQELADRQTPMMGNAEQPRVDPEKLMRQTLNQRQAMALSELGKMASDGKLPDGNGRWTDVINNLREDYEARRDAIAQAKEEDLPVDVVLGHGNYEETPNLMPFLKWLIDEKQPGSGSAAQFFKGVTAKRRFLQEHLGDKFKTWEDILAERHPDHAAWQPQPGRTVYLADTVPANLARELLEDKAETIGLTKDNLRKVMAIGGERRSWVVPKELAAQLDALGPPRPPNWHAQVLRLWKQQMLLFFRRFFKFSARNLFGDAEHLFLGNPQAFRKLPRAIRELYPAIFTQRPLEGEVAEWFRLGGFLSNLRATEIGDINDLAPFRKLNLLAEKAVTAKGRAARAGFRAFASYWRGTRMVNDYRESLLRYASYLDQLEALEATGKPRSYGASLRAEVDAVPDPRRKAFKLSNELIGAYDDTSVAGQHLAEDWYPFWRWKEHNFRIYAMATRNAVVDAKTATQMLKAAGVPAALAATRGGITMAKWMLRASAFWSAIEVFNHLYAPEAERELSEQERMKPHLTFGFDEQGRVVYFSRLGALGDLLEWFGLDIAPRLTDDWLRGKRSVREVATEILKSPVNALVQGLEPVSKTAVELLSRQTFFPDVFNPFPIRDRAQYFWRSLVLGNEWAALTGKPSRGYLDSLKDVLYYRIDLGQGAYRDVQQWVTEFRRRRGKEFTGFATTPRGEMLYNMKMAVRFGDRELAKKYLGQYFALGIADGNTIPQIRAALGRSLQQMHPLARLSSRERMEFVKGLSPTERDRVRRAIEFYKTHLLGQRQAERTVK